MPQNHNKTDHTSAPAFAPDADADPSSCCSACGEPPYPPPLRPCAYSPSCCRRAADPDPGPTTTAGTGGDANLLAGGYSDGNSYPVSDSYLNFDGCGGGGGGDGVLCRRTGIASGRFRAR